MEAFFLFFFALQAFAGDSHRVTFFVHRTFFFFPLSRNDPAVPSASLQRSVVSLPLLLTGFHPSFPLNPAAFSGFTALIFLLSSTQGREALSLFLPRL